MIFESENDGCFFCGKKFVQLYPQFYSYGGIRFSDKSSESGYWDHLVCNACLQKDVIINDGIKYEKSER